MATPLGNLEDVSPRTAATLRSVALIACEDTRRTSRLLGRLGISASTVSCHRFNEKHRVESILERLDAGDDVALVSDGGTPGVSDPGALLVRAALEAGLEVSPIPGPSAVAVLLSASGLGADRYVFDGFLPHRAGERRRRLRVLRDEERTLVFFETPHRILDTLKDFEEVLGPREIVLGRELTKVHETLLRGSPAELLDKLGAEVRGEITLAVAGATESSKHRDVDRSSQRLVEAWREALRNSAGDRRAALRSAARSLGIGRAELHRRLAELGENDV